MEKRGSGNPSEDLKCDERVVAYCESISSGAGAVVGFAGCLVLAGWFFNIPFLQSIHPSFVAMKFNTALCFALLGLALWNLQPRLAGRSVCRIVAFVSAAMILALAGSNVYEYFFRQNLGIDQFFFQEPPGAILTPYLGRMSFMTAVNMTLAGISILLLTLKSVKAYSFSQILVLPLGIFSIFAFCSYLFQAPFLAIGAHFGTPMALHTSALFLLAFWGILCCRPQAGMMCHITSSCPGGKLLRRFLPVGIFLPLLLGGAKLFFERIGWISNEAGVALVAIGNLSVISIYTFFLAVLLNKNAIETERLRQESGAAEVHYRMLFASTKEGIVILDGESGRIMDCNGRIQEILGYSHEELQGQKPWEIPSFKEIVATRELFRDLHDKGFARIENLRLSTRQGKLVDLDMVSSAFVSGQSKYLQWNIRDITDRTRDQEKLLQLSHAVEQSPSVIVITDLAGNIEYVNPRFTQVTGYSREEALGQNPRVLKSGEHPLAFYQDLWATIKSGKIWRGQFLNRKKDGSHYWEAASISPVLGSDGKPAHYIAIKEDITEFKKLERIKDDFVSTVSHELRTPLTAIKESLNLVLDGSMGVLSSEQKAFLDIGSRNVDRLTALVASILDFQKLQSGKFNLQLAKCDINEICAAVVSILKSVASKKGLTLQFEAGAGLPPVRVDRDRILQVVTSFVSNGIKFTSEGGVTITTARQGENCLRVSVSDTGIGIKQEEVEQLFRGFTLLGPAEYHLTGSAGLGLAISKGIITQHRGRIGVESTQGKGSVFYFEIPIEERRRSR